MKTIGLILVIIGMGMAAAFGSQNADPVRLAQIIEGRADVLKKQTVHTLTAYCVALPDGNRSQEQLTDGCPPIPAEASADSVDELGGVWSKARKLGAAAKALVKQQKKSYCRLVVGESLTDDQAKDECPAVKKNSTEPAIVSAHEAWLETRSALAPVEVDAQAKRAAYCALITGDQPTAEQVVDGCTTGTEKSDVAAIEAARKVWMEAWAAVTPAREALKTAYANLCGMKVDGFLVSVQRSASCQPAKKPSDASAIAAARTKWQDAVKDAADKKATADASRSALCSVANDGSLSRPQAKAKCLPVPSKAPPFKVAELRNTWKKTAQLSKHAKAAKKYGAKSVDPGTRMKGWFSVAGFPFLLGLLIMVAGGLMARRADRKANLAATEVPSGKSATAPVDFGTLLSQTTAELDGIHANALAKREAPSQEDLDATKLAIEKLQTESFERIVSARSALIARYGMAGFAEVFGPFSGGERYVNRAWSSLVDMYWHETIDSLKIAGEHLAEANDALQRVIAEQEKKA